MESSRQSGVSQFSLRTLLIAIAVSAIVILVGTTLYQNYLRRTGSIAVIQLLITPSAEADDAWLEPSKLRELLLADTGFQQLKVIKESQNAKAWLYKHLVFNNAELPASDGVMMAVSINMNGEDIAAQDIDAILQTTINAMRSKGADSNTEVLVLNTK